MKLRTSHVLFALVVGLGLLVPAGAAQTQPKFEITAKWANEHATHTLKKDGRDNMGITVIAKAQDFTCAATFQYTVVVALEGSFTNWAGSSIEQGLVTLTWEAQEPGNNPGKEKRWEGKTRLNFAWDLDNAPRQGAEQVYKVKPTEYKISSDKTGPCVQNPPSPTLISSPEMIVKLPDRLDPANETGEPCDQNPDQPRCQTSAAPAADSPAPGVLILLGAMGMVAYLRRRQER